MRRFLSRLRWKRILVAAGAAVVAWAYRGANRSNVGDLAFANELAVPPLAEPTVDAEGRTVFDLRFTPDETDLVPDGPSETWCLNGTCRRAPRSGSSPGSTGGSTPTVPDPVPPQSPKFRQFWLLCSQNCRNLAGLGSGRGQKLLMTASKTWSMLVGSDES